MSKVRVATYSISLDGIEAALDRAREAAKGKDIRIGGGTATIRQYLEKGLIDEMHLAFSPVVLGSGEHFFTGMNLPALGFKQTETVISEKAVHVMLKKYI